MLHKNKINNKKYLEENIDEDICNFDSFTSEKSDANDRKNLKENLSKNKNNKSNISKKKISSRVSTKESITNLSNCQANQNGLLDLIESLKDKITAYENDMRALIDEKIQMQITINNLQMKNYNQMRKSTKSELIASSESIVEINRNYMQEVTGLNKELKVLNENIERQKQIIGLDHSILNETANDNELQTKTKEDNTV
jgi:hypothetical protein